MSGARLTLLSTPLDFLSRSSLSRPRSSHSSHSNNLNSHSNLPMAHTIRRTIKAPSTFRLLLSRLRPSFPASNSLQHSLAWLDRA